MADLLEGIKGAGTGWAASGGNPLGAVAGGLFGLFGGGSDKAQKNAMKAQLQLSKMMADLAKRQADIDMPYRANLFNSLASRGKQKFPRFLPRQFKSYNPYSTANRYRMSANLKPPTNRPSGGLYEALRLARGQGQGG